MEEVYFTQLSDSKWEVYIPASKTVTVRTKRIDQRVNRYSDSGYITHIQYLDEIEEFPELYNLVLSA
jgi:hypothetical protein